MHAVVSAEHDDAVDAVVVRIDQSDQAGPRRVGGRSQPHVADADREDVLEYEDALPLRGLKDLRTAAHSCNADWTVDHEFIRYAIPAGREQHYASIRRCVDRAPDGCRVIV